MRAAPLDHEDLETRSYDGTLVRRLLSYVKPHRRLVSIAISFMLVSSLLELAIPYISKEAIDRYLARLYQVFEADPPAIESLAGELDRGDFLPAAPGVALVRKAALESSGGAAAASLGRAGRLLPDTYYLFPAAARSGTDAGLVLGDHWLVPQRELRNVPPAVLLQVRGADLSAITVLALLAAGLILLGFAAGYGHVLALQIAGQRAMYDLRTALFGHLQTLSLSFFDRNPVGRLVTRVTNDIEALNEFFSAVLVNLLKDLLLIAGTLAILFALNVKLALVASAVLPFFVALSLVFRIKVGGAYRSVRRLLADLNSRLAEDLNGIKVIQAFRREAARAASFTGINGNHFAANMRHVVIFGIFRPAIEFVAAIGIVLVLIYGGSGVLEGSLTLGGLVAFLSYVRQMFNPIADLTEKYDIMQSAMASADRVFGLLDQRPAIADAPRPAPVTASASAPAPAPARIEGRAEFDDVSFSYAPDKPVLRNISFTVEPGKRVALVGPTGAGKTSILNLLCRFYEPDAGSIRLDGIDLRDLPIATLRSSIGIVLQDPFIFSRSLEENIRLGKDIQRDRIVHAAEMVQARDFIEDFPDGFDQLMAERGATLSTGQKQLLCFARALAHDPRILILDEATSSVDPATERRIQQAIETLMAGRTCIVVAHRLSTIKRADEILVIDDGRILERGTHAELLARRGIYYNLYLLQYRAEEPVS